MNGDTQTAIEGVAVTVVQLFGDHLDQFQQHLFDQNYADHTVRQYTRFIGETLMITRTSGSDTNPSRQCPPLVTTRRCPSLTASPIADTI